MSVESEVEAELNRIGVAGYRRAAAIRLAVGIDERGTASAVAELMKIMAELVDQPGSVMKSSRSIEQLRVQAGIPSLHQRKSVKRQASALVEGKGRRHAPVR